MLKNLFTVNSEPFQDLFYLSQNSSMINEQKFRDAFKGHTIDTELNVTGGDRFQFVIQIRKMAANDQYPYEPLRLSKEMFGRHIPFGSTMSEEGFGYALSMQEVINNFFRSQEIKKKKDGTV